MSIALTQEQSAAVHDRGGALLVSAAAGSGKTRVLVERLMSYLVQGHDVDEFLIVTFTKAAAAELRGRIAKELAQRLAQTPGDGHLRRQTALLYKARIGTIDSFCIDLLRECGYQAGVDPDFRVCDEAEGAAKRAAAMDAVLERRYARIGEDPGFQELVETLAGDRDDRGLTEVVEDIFRRVQSHPDPERWLRQRRDDFLLGAEVRPEDTVWGALLLEDAGRTAGYWADIMEWLRTLAEEDEIVAANFRDSLGTTMRGLLELAEACTAGWEQAGAAVGRVSFPRVGSKRGGDAALKDRLQDWRGRCKKQVEALDERLRTPAAEVMEDLRALWPAMSTLLDVVGEFAQAYRAEKGERLLDFSDVEHEAVALLVGEDGAPTPLALEWRERFCEIMVDEYQDTNEVQNVLFQALSRDGTNLFLVGDVKQSIYRFRLADPTIFLEKYGRYRPAGEAGPGEPRKQVLSRNFRSRPEVLDGVNFLFRGIMSREMGEMDYGDEEALYPGRAGAGSDPRCQVELDAVDLSGLSGSGEEEKAPKDLIEARAVARRLRELYDSGFPVGEGEAARPVRWEDMAVLLRSPRPLLRHYAAAFREQGIPWSSDGEEDFFDTTEIHTALAYLQVVDDPRQDVPLLAVLRSPVWGFSPDRLAELRAGAEGDLYSAVLAGEERGEADCAAFLAELRVLRAQAGEKNSHQFLWYLYERSGLPGLFGAMEDGERRQARLMALYDCARTFEQGGHKGLFGFLIHVGRMIEHDVPIPSGPAERRGVQVGSIHRSKGLEFPVVVAAGLSRRFNDRDQQAPILFHGKLGLGPKRTDRERMLRYTTIARDAIALALRRESRAEELRLLYVAMTRAEEKLILSATVNGRMDKLAPLVELAQWPVPPQVVASSGSLAGWVLLPALCRPEAGVLHDLVGARPAALWEGDGQPWDIRVVDGAQLEAAPGRPGAETAGGPPEEEEADPALVERLSWTYPHLAQVDLPSKLTATQLKGRALDEEAAEHTERSAERSHRPLSRPRFAAEERGLTPSQKGSVLHLAMQLVRLERADREEEVRAELERIVAGGWLTAQQAQSVDVGWIAAFWRSPLGRAARVAPRMEREFKFSLLVPAKRWLPQAEEGEEVLLQGVVDCWFQDETGAVTVVDFKTDAVTEQDVGARAAEYAVQLEAYAEALAQVLGAPVERRLLWFFRLGRAVEV